MSRVDSVLARLGQLYPKSIDLTLDRVKAFLARLGEPQHRLPPVVHVAGTNGKGSTVAFLRACLEAAGYRVHVYTSPHLVRFNERIRLAGSLIEDEALLELLDEVERANAGEPITLFEVTTAAAFLAFARVPADIVLLETGLGGRLDATNVVERPAVTAITPVSMDHMAFLGNELAQIAGEKAGILKPGVPAVLGPQVEISSGVLEARASEVGAPLFRHGQEWQARPIQDGWRFEGARWQADLPLPRLPGRHQIDNAGIAFACLEQLAEQGFRIDEQALRQGLARVEWPARMQRLTRGRLVDLLPLTAALWLDGGHNRHAADALAQHLKTRINRPLHIVLGMLNNRDPVEFVEPLAPLAASIHTVTIPEELNAHSAETLAAKLAAAQIRATVATSIAEALGAIHSFDNGRSRDVLICGSLYLAGQVLAENG